MKTFGLVLLGSSLACFTGGCVYPAYVAGPPPPPQAEVVTVSPGPGFFWVRGHWAWRYGRYEWIPGRWVARGGTVWVDGHYENRAGTYVWIEGRWR